MLKKALHRITVVWCLYGLARVAIFINPLVFRVAEMVKPLFEDNSEWEYTNDVPWNSASIEQNLLLWFLIFVAAFALFLAGVGIHCFANWFFNTNKKD